MAEPIQEITDVAAGLYETLLEQYKTPRADGSPGKLWLGIELLAGELQLIETALQELLTAFDLETAVGAQLDVLGRRANVARGSLDDDAYRPKVAAGLVANSSGTPEQIMGQVREYLGTTTIRYTPVYPGKFKLVAGGTSSTDADLDAFIKRISPAGVGGSLAGGLISPDAPNDLLLTADGNWIIVP